LKNNILPNPLYYIKNVLQAYSKRGAKVKIKNDIFREKAASIKKSYFVVKKV
jgi:hypothetical protein